MKRKKTAAFILITYCLATSNPIFASTDSISQLRLYGDTRYETAKVISDYYRSTANSSSSALSKVKNVVIATGKGYADALSASVLAQEIKAPILLVDSKVDNSQEAFAYIKDHLDPEGSVFIMGGEGIIGSEFEAQFRELGFSNIVRIAGKDRYATSSDIAKTLKDNPFSTVVISSGEQYADALSISSFAAQQGWPILLTPQKELPLEIKEILLDKKPQKIYITGGTGAISDHILAEIREILPQISVERLTGLSRFDTNIVIAKTFAQNPSKLYFTTGHNYADALAGSVVAAQTGDPIIFIDPTTSTLPKATAQYLESLFLNETRPNLVAFGGSGAVPDEIIKNVEALITGRVQATSLHSVPDITTSVIKGKEYSLPTTVRGQLYNSDWTNLSVQWKTADIDTHKIGLQVLEGLVEGYEQPIKLNLTVVEPLPMAEYTTYFNANEINRSENLRVAAQAIHGKLLAPGEVFSFNETVGKRTIEAGYKEAMIIEGSSFVLGVGGGVCQVSSTLYNAAHLAKLEIVERHHHSLPVGYVPAGQDATVYFSVLDFKFKNNTAKNIIIQSSIEKGALTVKIVEHS